MWNKARWRRRQAKTNRGLQKKSFCTFSTDFSKSPKHFTSPSFISFSQLSAMNCLANWSVEFGWCLAVARTYNVISVKTRLDCQQSLSGSFISPRSSLAALCVFGSRALSTIQKGTASSLRHVCMPPVVRIVNAKTNSCWDVLTWPPLAEQSSTRSGSSRHFCQLVSSMPVLQSGYINSKPR